MIANHLFNGNTSNSQTNLSQSPSINRNMRRNLQTGEIVYQDMQKVSFSNQPTNQMTQNRTNLQSFQDVTDLNVGEQFALVGDPNIINQVGQTNMMPDHVFVNPQIQFNQTSNLQRNFNQNQNIRDDQTISGLNNNVIFTFQPQSIDQMNGINNLIALPNNNLNNYEIIQFLNNTMNNNNNIQWLNTTMQSGMQPINNGQMFANRQVDANDRGRHGHALTNGDLLKHVKPVFSYSCLIALALKNSTSGALPVNEIYKYMMDNFPYFKGAPEGWKNSVRHNLSLNKAFQKTKSDTGTGTQRKGCLWSLKQERRESMDLEIRKWFKKHPDAIRRSMNNPDNFTHYFRNDCQDSNDDQSGIDNRCEGSNVETTTSSNNPNTGRLENASLVLERNRIYANIPSNTSHTTSSIINSESGLLNEIMTDIGNPVLDPWNPHSSQNAFFNNFSLITQGGEINEDPYASICRSNNKDIKINNNHEENDNLRQNFDLF